MRQRGNLLIPSWWSLVTCCGLLAILLAISVSGPARACAFHFDRDLPERSLSQQIASGASLFAARPGPDDPFRFGSLRRLRGDSTRSGPPHLVDSTTRRILTGAADHAVLFSRDADGTWTRLLLLDDTTGPVVAHMLAQADHWATPDGAAARRDFAAELLVHPDPRLRHMALRELDTLDYATLRAGIYTVTAEQLLEGIADRQGQAYAPIRILLLGIVGGEVAEAAVAPQLSYRAASGIATHLGAWSTAALELHGSDGIVLIERSLSETARPLSRAQTEEIVQALAVQSAAGDPALRGPGRLALLRFVSQYPDASFLTRAQALITSIFTAAMTDMKSGVTSASAFFAVLIAFLYGVLHTLGPGHGKTVVISYFVGSGGSLRQGLRMGTQIAVTHVLSAIVVIFILDFAVRQATGNAPSDYRLIRLASYAAISSIGLVMLWRAMQALYRYRSHDHHHASGCASCAAAARHTEQGADLLGVAIGVVPCTGALMVMLYGLANDLIGPAIVMVIAISVGMALAMAALGLLAIWGHNWARFRWASNAIQQMKFRIGARLLGAAFVLLIGAVLFVLTLSSPTSHPANPASGIAGGFSRTAQVAGPAAR